MNWYLKVMSNYFSVQGRARRQEYWMYFLVYLLIVVAAALLDGVLGMGLLSALVTLAHLVPSITVGVRRLHDIDRSGWWLLIALIPLIGAIVLLVFYVQEGSAGDNQYGPSPKSLAT